MNIVCKLEKHSTMHNIIISEDGDFAYITKETKKTKKQSNSQMFALKDLTKKYEQYLKDGYTVMKNSPVV